MMGVWESLQGDVAVIPERDDSLLILEVGMELPPVTVVSHV